MSTIKKYIFYYFKDGKTHIKCMNFWFYKSPTYTNKMKYIIESEDNTKKIELILHRYGNIDGIYYIDQTDYEINNICKLKNIQFIDNIIFADRIIKEISNKKKVFEILKNKILENMKEYHKHLGFFNFAGIIFTISYSKRFNVLIMPESFMIDSDKDSEEIILCYDRNKYIKKFTIIKNIETGFYYLDNLFYSLPNHIIDKKDSFALYYKNNLYDLKINHMILNKKDIFDLENVKSNTYIRQNYIHKNFSNIMINVNNILLNLNVEYKSIYSICEVIKNKDDRVYNNIPYNNILNNIPNNNILNNIPNNNISNNIPNNNISNNISNNNILNNIPNNNISNNNSDNNSDNNLDNNIINNNLDNNITNNNITNNNLDNNSDNNITNNNLDNNSDNNITNNNLDNNITNNNLDNNITNNNILNNNLDNNITNNKNRNINNKNRDINKLLLKILQKKQDSTKKILNEIEKILISDKSNKKQDLHNLIDTLL